MSAADAGGEGLLHPVWVLRILYGWWALVGVQVVLAGAPLPWEPTLALMDLPDELQVTLGCWLILGAAGCLLGTARWRLISKAWAVERTGLWLSSAGWAAYALAAAQEYPAATVSWGTQVAYLAVCVVRILVLARHERATIRALGGA